MATTPRKKTYAKKTREKRAKAGWGLPKINLRTLFYGTTFAGGFGGFGWLTGCYNQVSEGAANLKNKTEQVIGNANKNGRQDNDKPSQDDNSPELPAIPKKDRDNVVKHKYYTLLYNEKHEQAQWVAYKLEKKLLNGVAKRKDNFRPDPDVPTQSATPADYRDSGYDRGHIAPAGDFKISAEAMSETFFMSNMSPQLHVFNAGIWEQLESKVRDWAQNRGTVYVVAGPLLQDGLPTIGKANKVSVPKEYFKVVLDPEKKQMIGFIMQNRQSFKQVPTYALTVDEIEKRTGLDFFPYLPDSIEDKLESQVKIDDWFFDKKKK